MKYTVPVRYLLVFLFKKTQTNTKSHEMTYFVRMSKISKSIKNSIQKTLHLTKTLSYKLHLLKF